VSSRREVSPWHMGFGLVVLSLLLSANGCVAAGAAAAGTAAGISYTNRGAKGDVRGSVDQVARHAANTFQQMGIVTTETKVENGGTKRVLGGKRGDLDVETTMTASGGNVTHVEVVARKSMVQWNKDYARDVLERIVRQG